MRLLTLLATLAISVALVFGFLGRFHPAFDAFAHLRLHLAALLFICGLTLFGLRYWLHGLTALLLSIGAFAATNINLPRDVGVDPPADQPAYKLLQLNVFHANPDPKRVLSLIAREHPDIVTLQEITDRWRTELDHIKTAYPYKLDCEGPLFGTVILSRRPIAQDHGSYCAPNGRLALARIDLNGRIIDVIAFHLPWPWPFEQTAMIDASAPLLQSLGTTAIAAGDFNATPWSAAARRIMALGGFTKVEHFGPTWIGHYRVPDELKILGLPIDQIMTKGKIVVHSALTLENAGSDHLPVVIRFSIEPEHDRPPTQTVFLKPGGLTR